MRRAAAVFTAQGFVVTAVATDHQQPLRVGPVPGWLPTLDPPGQTGSDTTASEAAFALGRTKQVPTCGERQIQLRSPAFLKCFRRDT